MPTPSEELKGLTLDGGWVVLDSITKTGSQTGGHFSSAYIVCDASGKRAFLKAMDYTRALASPDPAAAVNAMTSAYLFERRVLEECANRRMTKVVRAIQSGKVMVNTSPVEYLIFELADGDIRSFLDTSTQFDLTWRLSCLHNIFVGINQLNLAAIAHQDVKPSNVLVFKDEGEKIADLGRAWHKSQAAPHDDLDCAGDRGYAPPELLYGYTSPNADERRYGADFYLLGSMVLFLFTGLRATPLLLSEVHPDHRPRVWRGSYHDVLPYLEHAFAKNLEALEKSFSDKYLGAQVTSVVRQMCHPNLALRGDASHSVLHGSRFNLQRLISLFDRLRRLSRIGKVSYS